MKIIYFFSQFFILFNLNMSENYTYMYILTKFIHILTKGKIILIVEENYEKNWKIKEISTACNKWIWYFCILSMSAVRHHAWKKASQIYFPYVSSTMHFSQVMFDLFLFRYSQNDFLEYILFNIFYQFGLEVKMELDFEEVVLVENCLHLIVKLSSIFSKEKIIGNLI